MSNSKKLHVVDLFAGCGGLSLGLEMAGFHPVFVNELNKDALESYLINREDDYPLLREPKYHCNDVKDLVLDEDRLTILAGGLKKDYGIDTEQGELDLLVGGPPCQGFSGIGHRRSYSVEKKQLPSNQLFEDMAYVIAKLQPKIFLFENVKGLLSAKWTADGTNGEIFEDVLETFRSIDGYSVQYSLVKAKDYGVAQNRPRVLVVGIRNDVLTNNPAILIDNPAAGFLPPPSGGAVDLIDLLEDLIDPDYENGGSTSNYKRSALNEVQILLRTDKHGVLMEKGAKLTEQDYSKHADHVLARFKYKHQNDGAIPVSLKTKKFAQRLLPARWQTTGPTITATSLPDDYVHFLQPRTLTVREWARLQGFPDFYEFSGSRTTGGIRRAGNPREGVFSRDLPKYTQIGNAVPVLLAKAVGEHFVKVLNSK